MPEQPIGTILSSSEADSSFGSVLSSAEISSSLLTSLSNQTTNYMMFKIIGSTLYILGDGRTVLSPQGRSVDSGEVFAIYSKSKVIELIETGGSSTTVVEKRSTVYSVTNGQFSLEFGSWCPPLCGQE